MEAIVGEGYCALVREATVKGGNLERRLVIVEEAYKIRREACSYRRGLQLSGKAIKDAVTRFGKLNIKTEASLPDK